MSVKCENALLWARGGDHGNQPCPICQPEGRADQHALSVRFVDGKPLVFCHKSGCDFRDILRAADLRANTVRLVSKNANEADLKRANYETVQLAKAHRLWATCVPIVGTMGEAYLRSRGITCALPTTLGWATDVFHGPSARWLSAMVANVSTGGVHRTYFEKSGLRISGNAKMMLGPCAGGAVVLSKAKGPYLVCEGIETGFSLLSGLFSRPATTLAALSTSGMRALDLPIVPGEIIIATDSDDAGAGHAAGRTLAERASAQGWVVSLLAAPDGMDWNDVLTKKGGTK